MRISPCRAARAPRRSWCCLFLPLLAFALSNMPTQVRAQAPSEEVVRVEEDWELVVDGAKGNNVAPQVVCAFSPLPNLDSLHATLELNHQNVPSFVPGGLQLQLWNGEEPLTSSKYPDAGVMNQEFETVRWTQVLDLRDGNLTFEIINGQSDTWSSFGGQGHLRESVSVSASNLNLYDPSVSTRNSGVSYAGNVVRSLVLTRVRLYMADGQVREDATPRVVQ